MNKKYIDAEHFKSRVINAAVTSKKPDLCEMAKGICEMVDFEQSANVAPVVHGHWIEKPFLLGTSRFCSLCGSNYGMPHEIYNFCPNCGAKIDGVDK